MTLTNDDQRRPSFDDEPSLGDEGKRGRGQQRDRESSFDYNGGKKKKKKEKKTISIDRGRRFPLVDHSVRDARGIFIRIFAYICIYIVTTAIADFPYFFLFFSFFLDTRE